jgi:hypothetical protein
VRSGWFWYGLVGSGVLVGSGEFWYGLVCVLVFGGFCVAFFLVLVAADAFWCALALCEILAGFWWVLMRSNAF